MDNRIELKAYAKINLGLDVLGKRQDGYHDLRTVMQTIGIYDSIALEKTGTGKIEITVNVGNVPADERNLAWRAADLMFRRFALTGGMKIEIVKNIPVAAGLAGGSTDAAAVIRGIDRMYDLGLSQDEKIGIGREIGADVPFCLVGGTVLAEGVGDRMTVLDPAPDGLILVAVPQISVSTKEVFEGLDLDRITPDDRPDMDGILKAIKAGDLKEMAGNLGNVLETVTARKHPEIGLVRSIMEGAGARGTQMSGSGPSVFGFFTKRSSAEVCGIRLRDARENETPEDVYMTGMVRKIQEV